MATQPDLAKIGLEGFDLIDMVYGPPTKRSTNGGFTARQRQGRWGVQATHDHSKEEPAMNSKEAAVHYGGIAIVNYPKGKVPQKEPVMNSKEAAVHYGGMAVANYPKGKVPQNRWGRQTR